MRSLVVHFLKGGSMRVRDVALSMMMLGMFVGAGCSPSNEEAVKGPTPVVTQAPDAPVVKGYGDAVKLMEAQQKEKAAAAKKATKKP
jgi:hypothetical protein